jgi:hypothetical protein
MCSIETQEAPDRPRQRGFGDDRRESDADTYGLCKPHGEHTDHIDRRAMRPHMPTVRAGQLTMNYDQQGT